MTWKTIKLRISQCWVVLSGIVCCITLFYYCFIVPVGHFVHWLKTGEYEPYTLFMLIVDSLKGKFINTEWVKIDDFLYSSTQAINMHWIGLLIGVLLVAPITKALFDVKDDFSKAEMDREKDP